MELFIQKSVLNKSNKLNLKNIKMKRAILQSKKKLHLVQ